MAAADAAAQIERLRLDYSRSTDRIEDLEFGPDPRSEDEMATVVPDGYPKTYEVAWLATISSVDPRQGWFLHELARLVEPRLVVELGTCVGISASYLATGIGGSGGHVHSFEGGVARTRVAEQTIASLGLDDSVTLHVGRHEDAVHSTIPGLGPIDLGFVDSDHVGQRTVAYFDALRPLLAPTGIIVFDDIDWSAAMGRAWTEIRSRFEEGSAVRRWHSFGLWIGSEQHWEEAGCESLLSLPR